jgi:cyclic pyranopterin phosphate synthase
MSTTPEFSHIRNGHPCMVDIEGKAVTLRIARARAHVCMPPWLAKRLSHDDIVTKKGPVFQTAIIAGVMAAKQTSSLIPLCHPIALDKVGVDIVIIEPVSSLLPVKRKPQVRRALKWKHLRAQASRRLRFMICARRLRPI